MLTPFYTVDLCSFLRLQAIPPHSEFSSLKLTYDTFKPCVEYSVFEEIGGGAGWAIAAFDAFKLTWLTDFLLFQNVTFKIMKWYCIPFLRFYRCGCHNFFIFFSNVIFFIWSRYRPIKVKFYSKSFVCLSYLSEL